MEMGTKIDAGHNPCRLATMHCYNCGQTTRMRLLIELAVQIGADGRRRLPEWSVGLECPRCASTDVEADHVRLLDIAIQGQAV